MDWYEALFGVSERDAGRGRGFVVDGEQLVAPNGRRFGVGRFSTPRLDELRRRAAAVGRPGSTRLTHEVVGDALELHGLPDNAGAMFQVASQLNALEFPGPHTVPEDGVTGYAGDPTQGPACALAAAAATVYRNDLVPIDGQIGQSADLQLDLLADLSAALGPPDAFFTVRNGYTSSDPARMAALADALATRERDDWLDLVRIGVQSRVEVTFSRRFVRMAEPSYVSQALCSAISCGYARNVPLREWRPLATLVLDAIYEATLWAAVLDAAEGRGSGRVWLTMVGGGVFANEPAWIASAIRRALDRVDGHDLDVRLAHYGQLREPYARL